MISLGELYNIYNRQNTPVDELPFIKAAALADCKEKDYALLERSDIPMNAEAYDLDSLEIIADYLFVEDPDRDIPKLRRQQKGKEYRIYPKEEFLLFAQPGYYPSTPAKTAMLKYLRRREKSLSIPAEDFCDGIQEIISIDAPMQEVINIVEAEGLVFNKHWDIGEFAALYKDLNNSTPKHANRGHTPDELFAQSERGKQLAQRNAPPGQMSLFDEPAEKPRLTIVGKPARNAPCPCGSGRKYKNCCGKG